jgi:dolichol-phosphate mannosyltransferase
LRRNDTLIALPTYNEARNIGRLIDDLRRCYPAADMLVIDDGSPDGTGAVAEEAAARHEGVFVVQRGAKKGLGTAHVLAMRRAIDDGYRVLVTMDCDYTHRPEDVAAVVAALGDSYDFVVGTRHGHPEGIADWPMWRRAITRTAHLLTKSLLGLPYDATNAFRAYRTEALARVPFESIKGDGYSFMFEMVYDCRLAGLRMTQVPVRLPLRQAGKSKISRAEIAKAVAALGRLSVDRARRSGRQGA